VLISTACYVQYLRTYVRVRKQAEEEDYRYVRSHYRTGTGIRSTVWMALRRRFLKSHKYGIPAPTHAQTSLRAPSKRSPWAVIPEVLSTGSSLCESSALMTGAWSTEQQPQPITRTDKKEILCCSCDMKLRHWHM